MKFNTRNNKVVLIKPDEPLDSQIKCNPLRYVSLVFSSPVTNEEVKNHVKFTPDLAGGRDDYDPWENRRGYSRLNSSHRKGQTYDVALPEVLKAWQEYHVKTGAADLKDEFGRSVYSLILS